MLCQKATGISQKGLVHLILAEMWIQINFNNTWNYNLEMTGTSADNNIYIVQYLCTYIE